MKKIHLSTAALLIFVLVRAASAVESGPPQHPLKAYSLGSNTRSADISPDEALVATQITRLDPTNDPSKVKFVELVQLWDFRKERLIAEAPLLEVIEDKDHRSEDYFAPSFTRFIGDGKLLAVYIEHVIYLLSGTDLRELRKIRMNGPAEEIRSYKDKSGAHSYTLKPQVRMFEVSPIGHKVAVSWETGWSGDVEVYDLDSSEQLSEWRGVGISRPTALQWESSGQRFVVAAPDAFPFLARGNQPDLFVVDPSTGAVSMEFASGLLVGGIAVTTDDRVWVVDCDRLGVFANHTPKMKVFDLHTGKRLHELSGRGNGVRYAVSASENGNRVAAYTGKMKVHFDWGDMVPDEKTVDRTFSVWNAQNYEGIVTSQDLTDPQYPPNDTSLRISSKGGFVLFGHNIYELPGQANTR